MFIARHRFIGACGGGTTLERGGNLLETPTLPVGRPAVFANRADLQDRWAIHPYARCRNPKVEDATTLRISEEDSTCDAKGGHDVGLDAGQGVPR